jgi:hypothetical protein
MPMYVIERAFADQLDLTSDDVKLIEEVNTDEGVRWLFSFLSADRRRSYCLYEAPSPDMILAAAKRAGIPADAVVEVNRISRTCTRSSRSWRTLLTRDTTSAPILGACSRFILLTPPRSRARRPARP